MATKGDSAPGQLYEQDFYAWTRRQAALLRARRFNALDLKHLVEAVEELGEVQREAVLSNARVVLEHLLKLAHSPAQDPRNGGRATVREHRARLELGLTPQLREALQDELERVYEIARRQRRGRAARSRRASRSRRPPRDLSLRSRPDHVRLVAVRPATYRAAQDPTVPGAVPVVPALTTWAIVSLETSDGSSRF